jgi:hypothetical protein
MRYRPLELNWPPTGCVSRAGLDPLATTGSNIEFYLRVERYLRIECYLGHWRVMERCPARRHPSAMTMICAMTSAAAAISHTQPMSAPMVITSPAAPSAAVAAAARAGAPPVARHNDGMSKAMGSQEPTSTATPSRSSGEGPCVLLNEKTRSSESGSATIAAPTTEPAIHRHDRHNKDFLVTVTLPDTDRFHPAVLQQRTDDPAYGVWLAYVLDVSPGAVLLGVLVVAGRSARSRNVTPMTSLVPLSRVCGSSLASSGHRA